MKSVIWVMSLLAGAAGLVLAAQEPSAPPVGIDAGHVEPRNGNADGTAPGTPLSPGDHTLVLRVGDLDRRYVVHVPPDGDGRTPLPVVIMFHGGGGTARGAMRETDWALKADREGFLAVFPEALPPDPTRPSQFRLNGQIWNDGSGRAHAGRRKTPDVAFVNAMIDDLVTRFNVDSRRLYATGFSNGASMAFRVGCELSGRLAAVAPVAGALWIRAPPLERPVSLFYITGDADPLNPLEGGPPRLAMGLTLREMASVPKPPVREYVTTWARLLGCQADPETVTPSPGVTTMVYRGGHDENEVRYTVVTDHGHVWPGGRSLLPESWVGTSSDAFHATDAIWEFFERHPMPERR